MAITFAQENKGLSRTSTIGVNWSTAHTITFWFKTQTSVSGVYNAHIKWGYSGDDRCWYVQDMASADGNVYWYVFDENGTYHYLGATGSLSGGEWIFHVLSCNGSNTYQARYALLGATSLTTVGTWSGAIPANAMDNLQLGWGFTDENSAGTMFDLKFFTFELTDVQALQEMWSVLPVNGNNLIWLPLFDQPDGISDLASNLDFAYTAGHSVATGTNPPVGHLIPLRNRVIIPAAAAGTGTVDVLNFERGIGRGIMRGVGVGVG